MRIGAKERTEEELTELEKTAKELVQDYGLNIWYFSVGNYSTSWTPNHLNVQAHPVKRMTKSTHIIVDEHGHEKRIRIGGNRSKFRSSIRAALEFYTNKRVNEMEYLRMRLRRCSNQMSISCPRTHTMRKKADDFLGEGGGSILFPEDDIPF